MIQEFLTWGRRFEGDVRRLDVRCQERDFTPVILRVGSEIETSSHSAPLAAGGKKHMLSWSCEKM